MKIIAMLMLLAGPTFAQNTTASPLNQPVPATVVAAVPARLYAPLSLGNGFTAGISGNWATINTLALRDIYNGEWLIGYGHEILELDRNNEQLLYLDVWNAFAVGDNGRGVLGASIGTHLVTGIVQAVEAVSPLVSKVGVVAPPWVHDISQFVSLEAGAGDRLFGNPLASQGVKNQCYIIGGEVKVPFGNLFGVPGSL